MGSAGCKQWWPLIPEVEPDQHEESQWVTPFFPNFHLPLCTLIPHVLHWSCPKDYQSSFPRSELVCPSVPRGLSPERAQPFWSLHMCVTYFQTGSWVVVFLQGVTVFVWLMTGYDYLCLITFSLQLCQVQTLPGISVPTLWHALLRYFWGRGQMRCVPQIVLMLQWNGDGPEITCTSHHLHQIALQRNSAAESGPF